VAQVVIDYFDSRPRRTEREMGWCRNTVETGLNELRSNIRCLDDYSSRGNKRTEDRFAGLEDSIQEIVQHHAQTDPDFQNPYSYLKITAKSVRQELVSKGYSDAQLPTENTIGKIFNRMNYSLKRVQKKSP